MKKYIAVLLVLCVMIAAKNIMVTDSGRKEFVLTRPEYDEEELYVDIQAQIGKSKIPLMLDIKPRQLSAKEVYIKFEEAKKEIEDKMTSENESLSCVTKNLELPDEYQGISIFWLSSDDSLVTGDGTVNPYVLSIGEKKQVILTAVLSYEEYRMEYCFDVWVVCRQPESDKEKSQWLGERIRQALEAQAQNDKPELPSNIDGMDITYVFPEEDGTMIFGFFFMAVAALAFAGFKKKKAFEKARLRQMDIDYCEVVSKLTLLMGAGLTIRNAWKKIVDDYQKGKKENGIRYVYEEMTVTVNELASGVMETVVYENFGRRCNTPRYIKLGSLLEQNFLKGSRQLLKLLEEESDRAFEERKLLAKKQGEEASTKLLIPLGMELIAVMAIVMAPALMNF